LEEEGGRFLRFLGDEMVVVVGVRKTKDEGGGGGGLWELE